jgi:hypothetical protein
LAKLGKNRHIQVLSLINQIFYSFKFFKWKTTPYYAANGRPPQKSQVEDHLIVLIKWNIFVFLAAMSSSRSDVVTPFVRSSPYFTILEKEPMEI